jgi:hypothetical protein
MHELNLFKIHDIACYFCPTSLTHGNVVVADVVNTEDKAERVRETLLSTQLGNVSILYDAMALSCGVLMTNVSIEALSKFLRRQANGS